MSLLIAASLAALGAREIIWVQPRPMDAEASLGKYERCLRHETQPELGSAPLPASGAEAVVARAVAACRSERGEAREAILFERLSALEAGRSLDRVELDLVDHLQKPKAADAAN